MSTRGATSGDRPAVYDAAGGHLTVYDAAGGLSAMERLAHAWHARCLEDPLTAHPFTHAPVHPRHGERLAAYWAEQLGGPPLWTRGGEDGPLGTHEGVARLHAGESDLDELNRRAVAAFVVALDDAAIPPDPALRATLTDWFTWAVGLMGAYPRSRDDVPPGLPMPHWTWGGPA